VLRLHRLPKRCLDAEPAREPCKICHAMTDEKGAICPRRFIAGSFDHAPGASWRVPAVGDQPSHLSINAVLSTAMASVASLPGVSRRLVQATGVDRRERQRHSGGGNCAKKLRIFLPFPKSVALKSAASGKNG
jgi:hypothetical protein